MWTKPKWEKICREVLSELNKTSGVTGSMVVGHDGIVIASDLGTQFDQDAVGALAVRSALPWPRALSVYGNPRSDS